MSYARWSEGDVYIYLGTDGVYHCMCCPLMPTRETNLIWNPKSKLELHEAFSTTSGHEMLEHMKKHREAGHTVPDYAIDRLTEELKM